MSGLSHGGQGRCLCGAVSYVFDAAPDWQAHCHCESCRRATSSPFTSYFGVRHGHWRWTGAIPAMHASSSGARRHFCAGCGAQMAFEGAPWPDEIHFFAASLDNPADFRPECHVHWNERLAWVHLDDDLPKHRTPRRVTPDDDPQPVLALIRAAFAGMAGRIDPPSSARDLTAEGLRQQAATSEIWVLDDAGAPIACMILTARPEWLYLGKLAVAADHRGAGLGRQLVDHACLRAMALGLRGVELQTRVELTENHAAFAAMGFDRIAETAHPGYDRPTSLTFRRITD